MPPPSNLPVIPIPASITTLHPFRHAPCPPSTQPLSAPTLSVRCRKDPKEAGSVRVRPVIFNLGT
jgi:hypothetical protein